jgi:hypothetical protein
MGLKAAMREHAVIADRDTERGEKVHPYEESDIVPVNQVVPEQPDRVKRGNQWRYDYANYVDHFVDSFTCHLF